MNVWSFKKCFCLSWQADILSQLLAEPLEQLDLPLATSLVHVHAVGCAGVANDMTGISFNVQCKTNHPVGSVDQAVTELDSSSHAVPPR